MLSLRFSNISIRATLALVIGSLGLLLLIASLDGLRSAIERFAQTTRLTTLTAISLPLSQVWATTRLERGTIDPALMAEAAINASGEARINTLRITAENNYRDAMQRLSESHLPELAGEVAKLRAAHDELATFRPKADAAVHQPMAARDPTILRDEGPVYRSFIDTVASMGNAVESTLKLIDPIIDQFLSVKRAALWMREYAGLVTARTTAAIAANRPWSDVEIAQTAADQARAMLAWSVLEEAAARADTPPDLVDAIAGIKRDFLSFANGDQKHIIAALSSGHKPEITFQDLQKRNTEVLTRFVEAADLALNAMVTRAGSQKQAATIRLATDGAMLAAAIIFTTTGLLVASRRITAPIQAMTGAMRRLAGRDMAVEIPSVGRGDEIGAMAAAVQVFRDEMRRSAELSAEAEAHKLAEAQRERNAMAEREALATQQAAVVEALTGALAQLAQGNLTVALNHPFAPEYERLRNDFNAAVSGLQTALQDIQVHSRAITTGTTEIASGADDLAQRTERQAAGLQQTAAALDAVTATVRQTAASSGRAQRVTATAKTEAEGSSVVVSETVAAMSAIEGSARQIGQIIGVIDEIAFQTNLLALNAGVEAARAGESGRGFAVVAQEVRALAQRAADAAKEIKTLVTTSMQQVERGVRLVGETGQALTRIQSGVVEINLAIDEIAASATHQATGLAEVNSAVGEMDRTTQQNATMVEESTAATHALARETDALDRAIARFTLTIDRPTRTVPAHTPAARRSVG